jgi:hypothetical protein
MDLLREKLRLTPMGARLYCSDAPAPDPNIGKAAIANMELSKESLDFVKQIYAESAPDRATASAKANQVTDAQLRLMDQQEAQTQDRIDYEKDTFRPLEKQIVAEANAYDTPERRAAEAGKAMQTVGTQFDVAKQGMRRQASAAGIDPSSGNFIANVGTMGVREAATKAASGTAATNLVETTGRAMKADAAALGEGAAQRTGDNGRTGADGRELGGEHRADPGASGRQWDVDDDAGLQHRHAGELQRREPAAGAVQRNCQGR